MNSSGFFLRLQLSGHWKRYPGLGTLLLLILVLPLDKGGGGSQASLPDVQWVLWSRASDQQENKLGFLSLSVSHYFYSCCNTYWPLGGRLGRHHILHFSKETQESLTSYFHQHASPNQSVRAALTFELPFQRLVTCVHSENVILLVSTSFPCCGTENTISDDMSDNYGFM